jgi:hypothetical protein
MSIKWSMTTASALLALCIGMAAPAGMSQAEEPIVRVTLPEFAVTLNGHTIDNTYREYPLLVYSNITYFPMTWYDSRLLGLESQWSAENGLMINQSQVTSSYEPYSADRKNQKTYQAGVPASTITINGKTIDNSKEAYPLLSFRDVTYFPLTWRFAHDEFGWDYEWNPQEGLNIVSNNPQLIDAGLPEDAGGNDVALFRGHYYFAETKGTMNEVFRAPENDPTAKELIHSYSISSGYGLQKWLSFDIRDGELWLKYHTGGATMGSDHYLKVNEEGTVDEVYSGYLNFRKTAYGTLILHTGFPSSPHNLILAADGQTNYWEGTRLGEKDMIFGVRAFPDGSMSSGFSRIELHGDNVYVMASSLDGSITARLFKINLLTNVTTRVVDAAIRSFQVTGDKLYFTKEDDDALYAANLDGTGESKLSGNAKAAGWYNVGDGNILYTAFSDEPGQYLLYIANPEGEDALVLQEQIINVQVMDNKLICRLAPGGDYGVMILDSSGRTLLKIADEVSDIFAHDGTILLTLAKDHSVRLIKQQ